MNFQIGVDDPQTMNGEGREVIKQFVQNVEDFSSQYGIDTSVFYTACNLSGPPSNFPGYGDFPQSFVMRTYGRWWKEVPSHASEYMSQNDTVASDDFIEISFTKAVYPLNVCIYETYNPGALVRIWGRGRDRWHLLWEMKPVSTNLRPRIFSPEIRRINCEVKILRLEFNHDLLNYYTELDAVAFTGWRHKTDEEKKSNIYYPLFFSSKKKKEPIIEKGQLMAKILASHLLESMAASTKKVEAIRSAPSDTNTLGYFHYLPDETFLYILSFLDLKSLNRCAQVNKHFNRLSNDPVLYQKLSLKPYWHCINSNVLTSLSLRCSSLHKLDLSWCGSWSSLQDEDIIWFLEEQGSTITNLRLNCCKFVNNDVIECVSHFCQSLQELAVRGCTKIKDFSALILLEDLRRLDLYRTRITTLEIVNIVWRNPKLEHLDLGACSQITMMDEVAMVLGTNCKQLQSANFWKSKSLSSNGISSLGQCRKLREIDLGWCLLAATSGEWLHYLSCCTDLRKIFLATLRGISDYDLEGILNSCPLLEQVDLMGVCAITQNICNRILAECKHLRLFDISFCDQFSPMQIQVWRESYPNVQIKHSSHGNSNPVDLINVLDGFH